MPLTNVQKRHLRGLAHRLGPVVVVAGNGLTESVLAEMETALDHHELIKIRLRMDRQERARCMERIIDVTGGELVQAIGQIVCVYRRNAEKPRLTLPGDA